MSEQDGGGFKIFKILSLGVTTNEYTINRLHDMIAERKSWVQCSPSKVVHKQRKGKSTVNGPYQKGLC